MENLVIEKGIAFYSQDYSDAMVVETLKIKITPTDVENIKKAMEFVKNNSFVTSINVDLNGFAEYLDDDGNEVDVERFVVYSDSVYYYAQNKWHSGDQIESEAIDCEELGII